jgi:hypothetical protein
MSFSLPSAVGSVDTGNLANSQAAVSNRLAIALVMSASFRRKPSVGRRGRVISPTSGGG